MAIIPPELGRAHRPVNSAARTIARGGSVATAAVHSGAAMAIVLRTAATPECVMGGARLERATSCL
jgi:hypothetical protein